MKELIEALQIFLKYSSDPYNPTHCEHDIFLVVGIGRDEVTAPEDQARLKEIGFFWSEEYDSWGSFRYGSA